MKNQKKIYAAFGDIGCNTLLYFLNALDTCTAMGASESKRQGFVLSRPEMASKCISILGDSTECHSGLDATRNAVFRHIPGVKVVLDNYWTAMTGGQPAPTSPLNMAGLKPKFDLIKALEAHSDKVYIASAYNKKEIENVMKEALKAADEKKEFGVVVIRGACIQKVPNKKKKITIKVNPDKCKRCGTCLICPGNEKGPNGVPIFNNLCTGCGSETPACYQMCPFDAMEYLSEDEMKGIEIPNLAKPEEIKKIEKNYELPERLSVSIRGIGGQGNLFFGKVLAQLALLAGYGESNIVKGETHGMAQLGGAVISTFSCGKVYSPTLIPGSSDILIVMESSEVLRDGFLGLLKENGTILLSKTKVKPVQVKEKDYPTMENIKKALKGFKVIEADPLGKALEIGDPTGKVANVVMLGILSKLEPFNKIPKELWLQALKDVSPHEKIWTGNYHAFEAGRSFTQVAE